jgi:hypothetical protein
MADGADRFSLRVAVALTKHRENAPVLPGGVVGEPSTGALGALRDLFSSFATAEEREPVALVIGLECTNGDPATIGGEIADDARDALALYGDHVFAVGNPARGAGVLGLLRLALEGIVRRTADRDVPHYRIGKDAIVAAGLSDGRPGWSTEYGKFVRIDTAERQYWFWSELPVDSEADVRSALAGLAPEPATPA